MVLARWLLLAVISLASVVVINEVFCDVELYLVPDKYTTTKKEDTTTTQQPPRKKTRITSTTPINMAPDEGICNSTCVKKMTEKPCGIVNITTCPMNECVMERTKHCGYECNGVMCKSTCNSDKEKCYLNCTGINCEVQCNARKCRAVCTGINCIARVIQFIASSTFSAPLSVKDNHHHQLWGATPNVLLVWIILRPLFPRRVQEFRPAEPITVVIQLCHGEKCFAQCTGNNCTATCEGDNCKSSEFACVGYQCEGKRRQGYHKNECYGWFCESRCHSTPKSCSITCNGQGCNSECVGPECQAQCVGKSCETKCHGDKCNALCITNPCEAKCVGRNCTSRTSSKLSQMTHISHSPSEAICLGSHCRSECIGQSCRAKCNGLNCTVKCTGPFCDEEIFCTDKSCYSTMMESGDNPGDPGRAMLPYGPGQAKLPSDRGGMPPAGSYRVKLAHLWEAIKLLL